MDKLIGIVGLGIMGGAFARNLLPVAGRCSAMTWTPTNCRSQGRWRQVATAPKPGRAASDIITSLPTPKAVLAPPRYRTPGGPRIVVEDSTLSLEDKQAFNAILEKAGTRRSTARCREPALRPR